jgi:hypothetical protein
MRYLIIDVALAATMTSLFIVVLAAVAPGFWRKKQLRLFNYNPLDEHRLSVETERQLCELKRRTAWKGVGCNDHRQRLSQA